MKRSLRIAVAALATAYFCRVPEVRAGASSCSPINRANLVRCALEGSLSAKVERQNLEAAEARQEASRPILPTNPVIRVSAARRSTASVGPVINWYAALSQEIEIGGQRAARQRAAQAEHDAREKIVETTDRHVVAAAWRVYFEAIAAREEVRLTEQLETLLAKVAIATRAAADKGIISGVDADVADTTYLRVAQARLAATRHVQITKAALLAAIGMDSGAEINIEGDLVPIADVEAFATKQDAKALEVRPDVQAIEAAGRAHEARAALYRRLRIPNPTIGVFVQNDGFHERVIGAELTMPIPLPQPVGRTYAGEIAEAEALSRRAKTEVEQARRDIRLELTNARATFAAVRAQSDLYTTERLGRAEQSLRAMASEIEAGRLAVRETIVAQQALVEFLQMGLETRKNLALASVDLALAAGYPLEKGAP